MKKMCVSINGVNDVIDFVKKATNVNGDVICSRGRYVIDGKSIMGLFSIGVSEGITVEYPENATEFEEYISQFRCNEVGI